MQAGKEPGAIQVQHGKPGERKRTDQARCAGPARDGRPKPSAAGTPRPEPPGKGLRRFRTPIPSRAGRRRAERGSLRRVRRNGNCGPLPCANACAPIHCAPLIETGGGNGPLMPGQPSGPTRPKWCQLHGGIDRKAVRRKMSCSEAAPAVRRGCWSRQPSLLRVSAPSTRLRAAFSTGKTCRHDPRWYALEPMRSHRGQCLRACDGR